MELTIAANKGRSATTATITPYKAKYEVKRPREASKMEKKEAHAITSKSTKFSFKTKRTEGGLNLGESKRLSLKEMQAKEYPFFESDIPGMFEELLEAKLIELTEPKRPKNGVKEPKDFWRSELEPGMKWGDYPTDSKDEEIEPRHMYTVKDIPEMRTTPEAPQMASGNPQSFTVTFTDEDIPKEEGDHNRPLYVSGYLCDFKISKMLVDGGSAVNILPLHIFKTLGISTEDLQQTRVMIEGFNQGGQRAMGKVSLNLIIGELETTSWFHVIDSKATYNVLLGRPWIHNNNVVPSTLHQCLKYCKNGTEGTIKADENPFTTEEAHVLDAKFYRRKMTEEPQPAVVPEAPKAAQPSHPNPGKEVIEALKGLKLPLTQVEKVVSSTLQGFVTPAQGPKIEHGNMGPLRSPIEGRV
ncbi:hypothetical protein LIER_21847 [Lithospermum erythrorhizon]|uniref:Uncharacterized protein n=1 Tax=Lithospermum erythrorhizon TaxID=34254 RepID=A0AAV3QRM9_LITER